jgi:hypothetical protein
MRMGKGMGGGGCDGGGRGEEEDGGGAHLETPRGSRRAHADRATQRGGDRMEGGSSLCVLAPRGLLMHHRAARTQSASPGSAVGSGVGGQWSQLAERLR